MIAGILLALAVCGLCALFLAACVLAGRADDQSERFWRDISGDE